MTNETVCKSGATAITILETITKAMKPCTQKEALEAVTAWAQSAAQHEKATKMTREERQQWIADYYERERQMMTAEERRERAAFCLEGLEA